MTGISDLLGNVKTLMNKYHYNKNQSDAKYIAIDDLNSAIEAELTPAQPVSSGYNVSVSVTDAANSGKEFIVFLSDDSNAVNESLEDNYETVSNGSATFTNVEAGNYYVALAYVEDENITYVGSDAVTVENANVSVSFTVRNISVYTYQDGMVSNASGYEVSLSDLNGYYYSNNSSGSMILADGEYDGSDLCDEVGSDLGALYVDEYTPGIYYRLPSEQQDPEDLEGY